MDNSEFLEELEEIEDRHEKLGKSVKYFMPISVAMGIGSIMLILIGISQRNDFMTFVGIGMGVSELCYNVSILASLLHNIGAAKILGLRARGEAGPVSAASGQNAENN